MGEKTQEKVHRKLNAPRWFTPFQVGVVVSDFGVGLMLRRRSWIESFRWRNTAVRKLAVRIIRRG